VAPGDHEIVWLYAATNTSAWERFVAAVRHTAQRLQDDYPGLEPEADEAFPRQTTAVPQVALPLGRPGLPGGRLVFRWYKLTSDWNTQDWVETLLERRPPPLAIIGGSSSYGARQLAYHLDRVGADLPESLRPLLLLTTATADRVPRLGDGEGDGQLPGRERRPAPSEEEEQEATPGVPLNQVYRGRTFRFCFTNKQMAAAVGDFIWTQDDLRPRRDPVYMVRWDDDSYSRDLVEGFWRALRLVVTESAARQWSWATSSLVSGFPPGLGGGIFPVHHAGRDGSSFSMAILPTPQVIDSSVGSFAMPNRYEAKVAGDLLDQVLAEAPLAGVRRRPPRLLLVTGQDKPSRRFLRALARSAPGLARDFVVASGDAISFNTIYRDRQVAWPIQDLPFPLVFFCHQNPIDPEAGFRPDGVGPRRPGGSRGPPAGSSATGTEDILLYSEIVEALLLADSGAGDPGAGPAADPAELGRRLAGARLLEGRLAFGAEGLPLFNSHGKRQSGTGEHVVCLRPRCDGPRVLPEATIEVWSWTRTEDGYCWRRRGEPLAVSYDDSPEEGGVRGPE
jgi:hypothetical protein